MSKLEQFKQAIANPPPERLAKIEYQSHFMGIIGTLVVSIILILKGYWYVIFAFIFSIGVSYSQGISALMRYKMISSLVTPNLITDIENEKSYTRKRSMIINYIFGKHTGKLLIFIILLASVFIVHPQDFGISIIGILKTFIYIIVVIIIYIILYIFGLYYIAKYFYDKKVKGGNLNGR